MKLTQERKRIRIAEAAYPEFPVFKEGAQLRHDYGNTVSGPVNNYHACLNAIHEAEKLLTPAQWRDYIVRLMCVIKGTPYDSFNWPALGYDATQLAELKHATAAQCFEAIGQTLGLWKEGE